jgi:hypothetical protein
MDNDYPFQASQSPSQRVIVTGSIACFFSLALFYLISRRIVEKLEVPWVEWLIYATIPLAATFGYLYRSSWHQEISKGRRTWSALLVSGLILGGVLAVIGIIGLAIGIGSISLPAGAGGR